MLFHITWTLFTLPAPYSKFCEGGLMMANWPKYFKINIKINTNIVVFDWNLKLFVLF